MQRGAPAREAKLYYHDIGDYLSQKEKLAKIKAFSSIANINWQRITPNAAQDWINQRDESFDAFISLGDKKNKTEKTIFESYSAGVQTNRDAWVYNFKQQSVENNTQRMIDFYNQQMNEYKAVQAEKTVKEFIDTDATKISWSSSLTQDLERMRYAVFNTKNIVESTYRPYCKQCLYFDGQLNHRVYQMPRIFPKPDLNNVVICVTGIGTTKEFSAIISNTLPDLEMVSKSQCFPLHTYEKIQSQGDLLSTGAEEYIKQDNIPDSIRAEFRTTYKDTTINKQDIFYYVYGILHSPEYKQRFASNLKKQLPRIPFAQDFWAFSKAGCELADWHLNYESVEPYPVQESTGDLALDEKEFYRVQKMQFAKKGKEKDKTTLIYNSRVTLTGIPLQAYDYIVNGKPALEWIMERYQVTTDKNSGIRNDPNDWSNDPRHIIDLLKRMVRVSLKTVRIVESFPPLNERK